jgi:hypothetical protein
VDSGGSRNEEVHHEVKKKVLFGTKRRGVRKRGEQNRQERKREAVMCITLVSCGFCPRKPSPMMCEEEYVRRWARSALPSHVNVMSSGIVVSSLLYLILLPSCRAQEQQDVV